jgi:hypothetical protein
LADIPEAADDFEMSGETFRATLKAEGLYQTNHFVLRLSPRNHQLVDEVTSGDIEIRNATPEALRAYAVYLHETVHWWQHVGSTSGLIYSLVYPAQAYSTLAQVRGVFQSIGPVKPIRQWAEDAQRNGTPATDPTLQLANIAVNNAVDVDFYRQITSSPSSLERVYQDTYFESVGHCYFVAYGQILGLIGEVVGEDAKHFPSGDHWDAEYERVRAARHLGFYHGSPMLQPSVGLYALYEGQARFTQLQFLTRAGVEPMAVSELMDRGYFKSPYVDAFEAFIKHTKFAWPERFDDPVIALFLLIVDLAINPTRGIPLDIEVMEDFILDVDPGIRFTELCVNASKKPELATAIRDFSRQEYIDVSEQLVRQSGYDHPLTGLYAIMNWPKRVPAVAELMREHATFEFQLRNIPVRVMLAHFIAFASDKYDHPEFFCWPAAWLVGSNRDPSGAELMMRHLSLFTDRADNDGIFPRIQPGREESAVMATFNAFYASSMAHDLARQLILTKGPFRYDFGWLTQAIPPNDMTAWAKDLFKTLYGFSPDEFQVVS